MAVQLVVMVIAPLKIQMDILEVETTKVVCTSVYEALSCKTTVADNCHSNRTFLIRPFLILRFLI